MFNTTVKTIANDEAEAKEAIEKVHRIEAERKIGKPVELIGVDHALIPILAEDSLEQIGTRVHVLSKWKPGRAHPSGK